MSSTKPKNQPKRIDELAQEAVKEAPQQPSADLAPFEPALGNCEVHGSYPLNMQDERGHVRWYPPVCPKCREQSRASDLLASSNIPPRFAGCEFSNFDAETEAQQKVLARCQSFAEEFNRYRAAGACLLLCGRPGTGKNHLATAISKRLLADGYSVLRVKAAQYLDTYWSKSFEERETWLQRMAVVDLLMIDEIGRSSNAKSAQDAFFRLLDARYEAQLPSLIATNLNRDELIEVLGEATYDRLTQGGSVRLTFGWDSHRPKVRL